MPTASAQGFRSARSCPRRSQRAAAPIEQSAKKLRTREGNSRCFGFHPRCFGFRKSVAQPNEFAAQGDVVEFFKCRHRGCRACRPRFALACPAQFAADSGERGVSGPAVRPPRLLEGDRCRDNRPQLIEQIIGVLHQPRERNKDQRYFREH